MATKKPRPKRPAATAIEKEIRRIEKRRAGYVKERATYDPVLARIDKRIADADMLLAALRSPTPGGPEAGDER